jgi:hypothetical protein
MKKGDIVIGPTPDELMYMGMVCHKVDGKFGVGPYSIRCGATELPHMSHSEWEKVTCVKCLSLREV